MEEASERLNKYLAECGICSRREADRLIGEGRVSVNARTAVIGQRVGTNDKVIVDGSLCVPRGQTVVLAYYKPKGVTCTERDRHAARTVIDALKYPVRVTYAGRLDRDSEGLLLMTDDGALIHALMSSSACHEKEYVVDTRQPVTEDFLKRMEQGVTLPELGIRTRRCTARKSGSKRFTIILTQGLNRQIRRMCLALGNEAVSIRRVRVANILLGDLRPGEYREITGDERDELYRIADAPGRRMDGSDS